MKKLLAIMLTLVMAISIIAIIPTASGATIYKANNFEYIKNLRKSTNENKEN